MRLRIQRGIPVPPLRGKDLVFDKLSKLKRKESILFPSSLYKRARNVAYRLKPKTFLFRNVHNGHRCWRLS